MIDLDETQTIFSVSHKTTGKAVVSLSLVNGEMIFHFCAVQEAYGGVQPFTFEVPAFKDLGQQHVAITWQYKTSIRGRAVYELNIYRNCQRLHVKAFEVQDSCVRFGRDDADLHFPTLGQEYSFGPQGRVPTNFAAMHVGDIRIWRKAQPQKEICR